MPLRLQVEFLNSFAVVNSLRVDLGVADDHSLPDGLVGFLKRDVAVLLVFNGPEAVVHLDFFG